VRVRPGPRRLGRLRLARRPSIHSELPRHPHLSTSHARLRLRLLHARLARRFEA
jgi:hypothetical protein